MTTGAVRRKAASRRLLHAVRAYPCTPLRRAVARGDANFVARIPASLRRALDLTGGEIRPLRVELGGGAFPTPGYVHVDADRRARCLEYVTPVWDLPFEDESVSEILAVHVLEHVHPGLIARTLGEWRRVLSANGFLEIHVPNAAAIFSTFAQASSACKWALISSAIYGMDGHPAIADPSDLDPLRNRADHTALYDFPLLEEQLRAAGFLVVRDLTAILTDRHAQAWQGIVDDFSLIVRAWRSA